MKTIIILFILLSLNFCDQKNKEEKINHHEINKQNLRDGIQCYSSNDKISCFCCNLWIEDYCATGHGSNYNIWKCSDVIKFGFNIKLW